MKNNSIQNQQIIKIQRLFYQTEINIQKFRQNFIIISNQLNDRQNNQQNNKIIYTQIINLLIVEQKFYEYFGTLALIENIELLTKYKRKLILKFGYQIIQEVFFKQSLLLTQNQNSNMNQLIKKCNIDLYLLIAICKGYQKNKSIKNQKNKMYFIQLFKKNNYQFLGIAKFMEFHQNLVQKNSNKWIPNYMLKDQMIQQYQMFFIFFINHKEFFPAMLQIDNYIFRILLTLKLETQQQLDLYQCIFKEYFSNSYHFLTTFKNMRFTIQFFRFPFNQKIVDFYPQKIFVKLLSKYNDQEMDKIISGTQVGLDWTQSQISTWITRTTYFLMNSLVKIWIKVGHTDSLLKIFAVNIPKIFIFLKHEKLFNTSLNFLECLSLGPRNPTKQIMTILLQKSLQFVKKQCPLNKKYEFMLFLIAVESKYEKIANLEDKMYIELKTYLQQQINNKKIEKSQNSLYLIQQKINKYQWEELKMPLFGHKKHQLQNSQFESKIIKDYRGLYNIGNSCYMNSFLQCLFMTIQLRKTILDISTLLLEKNCSQKLHKQINQIKNQKSDLKTNINLKARQLVRPIAEIQRLFSQLLQSKRQSISPISVKNISSVEFKNTQQQDTIQFGRSLLDLIFQSSLQNIFQGEQTNEIICSNCHKSRFIKENFIDLMLAQIVQQNTQSSYLQLQKMFQNSFKSEQIQNLTCDYCQIKSQKSLKKHFISKFPNYMIITLKRFQYDVKQQKNIKKHYSIDLKQGIFQVFEQIYQIYGIIVHRGQNANSGHYFSFCRQWKPLIKKQQPKMQEQKNIEESSQMQIQQNSIQNHNQKMEIKNQQSQKIKQQNLIKETYLNNQQNMNCNESQQQIFNNKNKKWICFNDSIISTLQSFQNIKQFFDLNQEDTPYILFLQKISNITQKQKFINSQIKLRQPLLKFLQKDNKDFQNFIQNKRKTNLANNNSKIDWKNFGKTKGFTAYDFFKLARKDQYNDDQGKGGFGNGNMPIL